MFCFPYYKIEFVEGKLNPEETERELEDTVVLDDNMIQVLLITQSDCIGCEIMTDIILSIKKLMTIIKI